MLWTTGPMSSLNVVSFKLCGKRKSAATNNWALLPCTRPAYSRLTAGVAAPPWGVTVKQIAWYAPDTEGEPGTDPELGPLQTRASGKVFCEFASTAWRTPVSVAELGTWPVDSSMYTF
jgi:hypothetical protein